MKDQHSNIDEIFRQRLHDAEVPPPPFVWPAVEQGLQKRRRKVLFLWLFTVGTVTASVLLWYINANQGLIFNSNPAHMASPMPSAQETPPALLPEATVGANNSTPMASEMPSESGAEPTLKNAAVLEVRNKKTTQSRIQNATQTLNNLKEQQTLHNEQLSVNTSNTNSIEKPGFSNTNDMEENLVLGLEYPKTAEIFNPLGIESLNEVVSIAKQKTAVSLKTYKPYARRKKAEPKFCYDFAKHPTAWLLDVYAGPSLAQRSLTSRQDDIPYLNQRLATESRSTAMNAGLRASLLFSRNFLLRSGLHYDQLTEVFEYIDPTSVTYLLKFTPGNPVPDTLGVQYGENYLKTYNRYRMIDIPLLVGMEMRRGRSGFSINAGLSANILFQKSGVIFDPVMHEPARFGPISDDPKAAGPKTGVSQEVFRANVGLSANASIQWYWHLSPHFRLFIEPSFRQVLRPVTVEHHPVEQRHSILGLRLGATKIF